MSLSSHQIRGHKAAINNPNVSEEAKEHSRQVLDELESQADVEVTHESDEQLQDGKDETRVNAGYKATLKNPNVSEEAKDHAREILEEKGVL